MSHEEQLRKYKEQLLLIIDPDYPDLPALPQLDNSQTVDRALGDELAELVKQDIERTRAYVEDFVDRLKQCDNEDSSGEQWMCRVAGRRTNIALAQGMEEVFNKAWPKIRTKCRSDKRTGAIQFFVQLTSRVTMYDRQVIDALAFLTKVVDAFVENDFGKADEAYQVAVRQSDATLADIEKMLARCRL